MAPTQLKKLIALQNARKSEIENMQAELNEGTGRPKLLDALTDKVDQLETYNPLTTVPSGTANLSGAGLVKLNLPKLDLPKFSGKYEDWESLSDLFNTLVHSKIASDATKFSYLKLCLTGPAADLVKNVATTDANYAATWQALSARFFNPRLIVNKHLHALSNLPHLKGESAQELRSLADEAQRIVRALSTMKMPIEHWDVWLIYVLASRLDTVSREKWQSELSSRDQSIIADERRDSPATTVQSSIVDRFPKFTEFIKFLEKRSQTLSMMAARDSNDKKLSSNSRSSRGSRIIHHARRNHKSNTKCTLCSGMHILAKCPKLKTKNTYERRAEIRRLNLCFNCFGRHRFQEYKSPGRCFTCREKHHSLLHFGSKREQAGRERNLSEDLKTVADVNSSTSTVTTHTANVSKKNFSVILATAQVIVRGPSGIETRARALLDQGSETTFVSESIAQLVGLSKRRTNVALSGVGATNSGNAKFVTSFTLRSTIKSGSELNTRALILPRVTSYLPSRSVVKLNLKEFSEFSLADPQFYVRDSVDIILGADVYAQLLRPGLRTTAMSGLVAQDTALGWIISGSVQINSSGRAARTRCLSVQALHNISNDELNASLERFWDLNEFPDIAPKLRPEDEACEKIFRDTCARSSNGRFTVRLPFKKEPPACANEMRRIALGSLSSMYRRFSRDPEVALAYRNFMTAYEELGHMERVPKSELNNPKAWYLPHHAVLTLAHSALKKIRVVFDASRKTREKHCLNDFLMSGPALQRDLSLVLLNWRRYRYVFTADIVKMFRQIRVPQEDRDYQRILWAPSPAEPPVEYRLTTVTYGTACAPYLAIRTLLQLADEEKSRFPHGADCLKNNAYVDDIFAGADDLSEATAKRVELTGILNAAGIDLDKWAANHSDLLPAHLYQSDGEKHIDGDASVKTLGIQWNPANDVFAFSFDRGGAPSESITKRAVLSNIARLFDPLGWLSPVTVVGKILMQDLWLLKYDWDTALPVELRDRWLKYYESLASLPHLSIDRWLGGTLQHTEPEINAQFSPLTRLIRIVAHCLRPLIILRRRKQKLSALPKFLTSRELQGARIVIIKMAQAAAFSKEISLLKSNKPLSKRCPLRKFTPIIDDECVLRIGGRLAHSGLSNDSKNPPILLYASNLSRLIVEEAHAACLHGGPTLTASFVAQRAWILGRKRLVKSVIYRCVPCQRAKPHTANQLMGNLPAPRVTPARPFSIAGVDYTGPIQVRATKGRGHKSYKGYVALFICFVTKAVHLELVSDCTSASFIAAFRRFVGRRGICRKLYSDNATNFHGADRELRDMFKASSIFYKSAASVLANDGNDWKFIPPTTPHFGGLWEAGVKSVKYHLKRVVGEHTLTFEELSTMLIEVEVCLNSRPLYPLSSEVDDLHALTPGHFLIEETPALIPDEEPPNGPEHLLKRFNLLQRLRNNFWKRWSKEYLQQLQEKGKWKETNENFAVGQLVLVMDDRYPPGKWPLGRVIDVHPGADGLVRVVTVKTATNTFRRHIVRLSPLATNQNTQTEGK